MVKAPPQPAHEAHEPPRTTFQAFRHARPAASAKGQPSSADLGSADLGNVEPSVAQEENGDDDGGVALACVAMQSLRNLSQTSGLRGRLLCGATGAVRAALRCAALGAVSGEDTLAQCAAFLANLSEDPASRLGLVHSVLGVPALCSLARAPVRDARLDAVRALCNLACVEDNAENLYRQGGFQTLVDVVLGGRDDADRQQVSAAKPAETHTLGRL
jgi:hypothetical protein